MASLPLMNARDDTNLMMFNMNDTLMRSKDIHIFAIWHTLLAISENTNYPTTHRWKRLYQMHANKNKVPKEVYELCDDRPINRVVYDLCNAYFKDIPFSRDEDSDYQKFSRIFNSLYDANFAVL